MQKLDVSVSSQTELILKPLYSCDENEIFIFNDNMVLCAVQKTKERYKLNILIFLFYKNNLISLSSKSCTKGYARFVRCKYLPSAGPISKDSFHNNYYVFH